MRFRFYVDTWIFGKCPLEEVLDRVAALGFDGVELPGEPKLLPVGKVRPMLKDRGLEASSVCGMCPGAEPGDMRYVGHCDPRMRRDGIDYMKSCIDMVAGLGARTLVFAPCQVGSPDYFAASKEEDWKRAVESFQEGGEHAEECGIYVTIEPINRYEVGLINCVDDALRMARQVNRPNIRIMADTFHMHMEEPDGIVNAIRRAGDYLKHFHVADNTREPPGMGTMPWKDILTALHDIDFQGAISFEPMPRGASPYDLRDNPVPKENLDPALGAGLKYLRMLDSIVTGDIRA